GGGGWRRLLRDAGAQSKPSGTPLAQAGANKLWLEIRQQNIIRPPIAADRDVMAAVMIQAVDDEPAYPGGAHFSKNDFLWAGRHSRPYYSSDGGQNNTYRRHCCRC